MSEGILLDVPRIIRTYNVSRPISTTGGIYSTSIITQTALSTTTNPDVSPAACVGFAVLILSTVFGNTLVLAALFLDKRLHAPSFFLIANMAVADLLLGISVLPFSSVLELLNDRWIFGQGFCSAWLALDVLCCTASIIALMAVSIDRYIGVTRPLNYSMIMTTRRTIYLIIIVWGVSILTSVVPLFGLTDRGNISKDNQTLNENTDTCKVNKNTFYTIFSSMISFYIPVVILLILYSRVYQEAKKQGEKLESEKRRIYEIDYQIKSKQIEQQQNYSNDHPKKTRLPSNQSDEVTSTLLNEERNGIHSKKDDLAHKTNPDDNASHSSSSNTHKKSRLLGKRLFSTIKRSATFQNPHPLQYNTQLSANEELQIIKHKLQNLRREKKAFRTVGLILGALLICWLPFFVTLPLISILKHHNLMKDENTEDTWFKITFWLGYCNSALNPFVYAFSNRAIRRAFRQVIFRRFCCCCCPRKKTNKYECSRQQRGYSGSLTTETSQIAPRQIKSFQTDNGRTKSKKENDLDPSPFRGPNNGGAAVSFDDFLAETGEENNNTTPVDDKQSNQESISKKNATATMDL